MTTFSLALSLLLVRVWEEEQRRQAVENTNLSVFCLRQLPHLASWFGQPCWVIPFMRFPETVTLSSRVAADWGAGAVNVSYTPCLILIG